MLVKRWAIQNLKKSSMKTTEAQRECRIIAPNPLKKSQKRLWDRISVHAFEGQGTRGRSGPNLPSTTMEPSKEQVQDFRPCRRELHGLAGCLRKRTLRETLGQFYNGGLQGLGFKGLGLRII